MFCEELAIAESDAIEFVEAGAEVRSSDVQRLFYPAGGILGGLMLADMLGG
jgi:hypothetical protein